MKLLARGDQVVYVPRYVIEGAETIRDIMESPGVEYGFVTSVREGEEVAYVRYWNKHSPGELRTASYSERSPLWTLYPYVYVAQSVVTHILKTLPK